MEMAITLSYYWLAFKGGAGYNVVKEGADHNEDSIPAVNAAGFFALGPGVCPCGWLSV